MLRSPRLAWLLPLFCALVACGSTETLAPGQGSLRVSLSMTGPDPDADGAQVTVDGGAPIAVAAAGGTTMSLDAGRHSVRLEGLAANCVLQGEASRSVRVRQGDTTEVRFAATCTATSGVIEVSVTTTGIDRDVDGYLASLDVNLGTRLVVEGAPARFAPVPAGTHSITLSNIASNCAVVGGNPVPGVQVSAGGAARDTVRLDLTVNCTSGHGDLRLISTTNGPPDPDGYVVSLNTVPVRYFRLAANDTLLVTDLPVGTYGVALADLAGNCAVSGAPPASVTIVGASTATMQLAVDCVQPAVLRVTAPTTGSSLDPGYQVRVDGGAGAALLTGSTLSLDLAPGSHSVELSDVAPNCTVVGPNPAVVDVSTAAATDLAFPVTCVAVPRTGLDITISTSANNPDPSYLLAICADFYCYQPVYKGYVPANTTLQLDLPAGSYSGWLSDVASNCRAAYQGVWSVTDGQVSAMRIDVTCAAQADFIASVTATGDDVDTWFLLTVDGAARVPITPGTPVTVTWIEGVHSIGLVDVSPNCSVSGSNPVAVTLAAGALTAVDFTVNCQSLPVVNVTVSTTGSHIPPGYLVGIDPDWWYGYLDQASVGPNDTASFRVGVGSHAVWLDQVPANCTVSGPNPVTVDLGPGATADVAFAVTCQ